MQLANAKRDKATPASKHISNIQDYTTVEMYLYIQLDSPSFIALHMYRSSTLLGAMTL